MKSSNTCSLFSRLIVLSLSISLLCFQTMIASTLPAKGVAAAEITVTGQSDGGEKPFVVVNGERAFNGRTFFSNGTISTTETSSATVSLGKLGRINLAPSSSLSLSFSEGRIACELSKGNVSVSNMDGVSVTIDTPHDSITNEGNASSRFAVSVLGDRTDVAVISGTLRYHGGAEIVSKDDDDNDDDDMWDDWETWGTIALIAAGVVIVVLLVDKDDDTVSPVR